MPSGDDVYRKFGLAAEVAQLLETELGTLLIGVRGLDQGWHVTPDREAGLKLVAEIDRHTLGAMLKRLGTVVQIGDHLRETLQAALKARNRLIHGFFERHDIESEGGRERMMSDLDAIRADLVSGWQHAGAMTTTFLGIMLKMKGDAAK